MPNSNDAQSISRAKGRPMLSWVGKKPLEKVEYFPAQEKEVYGDKSSKDFNQLFWGDNLQVLSHLLKDYRGKIDLIYIDPPFDSKADYVKKVKIKGQKVEGQQQNLLEEKQYTDIWENDEYLQFMYERLLLMRELLSDKGCIYLHCDWRKVHQLRSLMDEVFGEQNIRNEIIWKCGRMGAAHKSLPTAHNTILHYTKTNHWKWEHPRVPYAESLIKSLKKDENGYYYTRGKMGREMADWEVEQGVGLKSYVNIEKGKQADDVWDDVGAYSAGDYPTQKPEPLLERIVKMSSEPGDIILDCFAGSGTTMAVAQKLGRRWIGCDINIGAIQTTTKRLAQIIENQKKAIDSSLHGNDGAGLDAFKGAFAFKVLNVNEYDIFKNEIEAKEIVMEMYGVEPIKRSSFDGTLDNHFVKVMPLNRVLNKLDIKTVLKDIDKNIDSFTIKTIQKQSEAIYEEGVMVICSGAELDVEDYLKKENKSGVKVVIRDILNDKKNLIFKQKPEARINVVAKDKRLTVTIAEFYSPILMRKLELENEKVNDAKDKARVADFRQIIDSVTIDVDYDGKLFNAEIMDLPEKKEIIATTYDYTYEKGGKYRVAVKIVDVLGEEYFETFSVEA